MENESEIFTTGNEPLLRRYSKHIITARVLIFVFAAICLLIAAVNVVSYSGVDGKINKPVYSLGISGLLYIILGLLSERKPYVPILIVAIIMSVLSFCGVWALFFTNTWNFVNCLTMLIEVLMTYFIIRGAVSAKKKMKLIKQH